MTDPTATEAQESSTPQIGSRVTARAFIVRDRHHKIAPGESGEVLEIDPDISAFRIRWDSNQETWANGDQLLNVPQSR